MNRYYLVKHEHLPLLDENMGHFHWIDLQSHGEAGAGYALLSLQDSHIQPKSEWIPFPNLYNARTTLEASKIPHEVLADIGLTGEMTTAEAVEVLGEIHPLMGF
jgi:hypothetical protein